MSDCKKNDVNDESYLQSYSKPNVQGIIQRIKMKNKENGTIILIFLVLTFTYWTKLQTLARPSTS